MSDEQRAASRDGTTHTRTSHPPTRRMSDGSDSAVNVSSYRALSMNVSPGPTRSHDRWTKTSPRRSLRRRTPRYSGWICRSG